MAWAQSNALSVRNFAVIPGKSGAEGCLPRTLSKRVMRDVVLAANKDLGIDPHLGVIFSLDVPPCADLFYTAVANDVGGIGYGHHYGTEIFDESPDSRLDGVAFLNDVHYWESRPEELKRAFLHEMGHRWSGRVHVAGEPTEALLGRDREHWSYFLDTSSPGGVSPLEGNAWQQDGDGYLTLTHERAPQYSDLDLYLMGALLPSEVKPILLVEPEEGLAAAVDCRGTAPHPGSPPQRCESVSVQGSAREISILDVVVAEGERTPAATNAIQTWTVAFYFLVPEGIQYSQEKCELWVQQVEELRALFTVATRERMNLENIVAGGMTCSALEQQLLPSRKGDDRNGCAYTNAGETRQRAGGVLFAGTLAAFAVMARFGSRRRRAKKELPG